MGFQISLAKVGRFKDLQPFVKPKQIIIKSFESGKYMLASFLTGYGKLIVFAVCHYCLTTCMVTHLSQLH